MALAREVQYGQIDDGVFAVQRDVLIDPATGRAAAVEKVTVAVPTDDGNVAVVQQQRVRVLDTQGPQQSQPRPQAITYGSSGYGRGGSGYGSGGGGGEDPNRCFMHCCFCLFTMVCPCCIIPWLIYCCSDD